MEESNAQGLEDIIARRLVDQFDATTSDTSIDRGGETEKEKVVDVDHDDIVSDVVVGVASTDADLATQPAAGVTPVPADKFAKVEKSLISLGFFTPSSRRIKDQKVKRINFTRQVDGKKIEAAVEFHPSAVLGLPITADQDKFLALHDIITGLLQVNGKVSNPIRFTSAELLRLLNKAGRSGKNYKDVSDWLDVMTATTIFSDGVVYEAGKKRFAARTRFHVFERAITVGKELPDGTVADANYVWLSDWQLENINQYFLLPIDLLTYRELKNHIAKALVPLLQVWLLASRHSGSFEKRYDDLCEMLSVQVYNAPSLIKRQLKPSLDELVRYEYLERWQIEKTADGKSYKIIFFHGSKFHRDRRKRIEQRTQAVPSVIIAQSEPDLPEPGKLESPAMSPRTKTAPVQSETQSAVPIPSTPVPVVELAAQLTTDLNQPVSKRDTLIDELSSRGLVPSAVIKLLDSIPADRLEDVFDYIDYWDTIPADRRGTGLLYSLIQKGEALPSSFETRRQKEKRLAAHEHRRQLEIIKDIFHAAYDEYRHQTIDRIIAEEVGADEFERRVIERKKETAPQGGIWDRPEILDQAARRAVRAQIAEQAGNLRFLPYEEFKRRELRGILITHNFNPADFPELGIHAEP